MELDRVLLMSVAMYTGSYESERREEEIRYNKQDIRETNTKKKKKKKKDTTTPTPTTKKKRKRKNDQKKKEETY